MAYDDPHGLLKQAVESVSDITTLFGSRLYFGVSDPPEGYEISQGPAACFRVRTSPPSYHGATDLHSIQIRVFGSSPPIAYDGYLTLYDSLHDKSIHPIIWGRSELSGQPLRDQDSDWDTVLWFFSVVLRTGA